MKDRKCYLMIRDVPGGLEFGVSYGLDEGEELPEDVEELTEAQYTTYKFLKVLQGTHDSDKKAEMEAQAREKPSGLVVPKAVN
jgi:hypothetical protein